MKKFILVINNFLIGLGLIEMCFITKSTDAFFPIINEPSKQELKSSSIKIGKIGIQLIKFGQLDEAIQLLELAVKLNPKEDALWGTLAEAQNRSNEKEKAILSLNKAIQINPEKENFYFSKASIYMNLNKPKKAILSIKKGLSINKTSERGYFQLGNAEIMLKNYKSALIAFQKSSRINPNFWQAINNEGLILYELDKKNKALSKFKLAVNISQNAEPMLALAIILFSNQNKNDESINLAKSALKANPQYVSKDYQEQQLWGENLQKAAEILFKTEEMIKAVKEAKEKTQ